MQLSLDGWLQGDVESAVFEIPVVPRKVLPPRAISKRQCAIWQLTAGWEPTQVVVTPDGQEVLIVSRRSGAGSHAYRVAAWDLALGQERRLLLEVLPDGTRSHYLSSLQCSPDGRWLAVSERHLDGRGKKRQDDGVYPLTNRLHLIDRHADKVAHCIETSDFRIWALLFSPDSQTLATVQSERAERREGEKCIPQHRGDVRLWNVATGTLRTTMHPEPGEGPIQVAFSPNGNLLATKYTIANTEGKVDAHVVKIWDMQTKIVSSVLLDRHIPQFLANGRSILAQGGKGLILHDLDSQQDRTLFQYDSGQWLICFNVAANGQSVFCFFLDGQLTNLELPSGKVLVEHEPLPRTDARRNFHHRKTQSSNGRLFAVSEYTQASGPSVESWQEVPPPEIHVWDATHLRRLDTITGHIGRVNDLAFSPDGRLLLSAGMDETIRLWDLSDLVPE